MSRFEALKCNTARLQIVLLNRGGAPAMDIDICAHFPDGFDVYDELGLDRAIVMPVEPEKPKTRLERMATRAAATLGRSSPVIGKPSKTMWSNVGDWSIKRETNFDVRTHVKELKHKLQIPLEPLFVVFPSREAVKSFAIDYELLAANVPDKIEGQLHVIVETL